MNNKLKYTKFYTLLTMHHVMILVNDQSDAQFFTIYLCLFLFSTLYMFRGHRAHHQERQIVSIQPLVTVILFTPYNTFQDRNQH